MIDEIQNAFELKSFKEVKISKKNYNLWQKLESLAKNEASLEMLSDKEKHIGEKATTTWLKEFLGLKDGK